MKKANSSPRYGAMNPPTMLAPSAETNASAYCAGESVVSFGAGRSFLSLHVRVTDIQRHLVVYEFDMAGGSGYQGRHGTLRASGLGKASHFDLRNAAERVYLTLSANPHRYAAHADTVLQ